MLTSRRNDNKLMLSSAHYHFSWVHNTRARGTGARVSLSSFLLIYILSNLQASDVDRTGGIFSCRALCGTSRSSITRERHGRNVPNFHIAMEMSLSCYIVGLRTRELILQFERLVYIQAPLVEIWSDLAVFCSVVVTFTIIVRAPRGAVR